MAMNKMENLLLFIIHLLKFQMLKNLKPDVLSFWFERPSFDLKVIKNDRA